MNELMIHESFLKTVKNIISSGVLPGCWKPPSTTLRMCFSLVNSLGESPINLSSGKVLLYSCVCPCRTSDLPVLLILDWMDLLRSLKELMWRVRI